MAKGAQFVDRAAISACAARFAPPIEIGLSDRLKAKANSSGTDASASRAFP